ncbi:hypothetical protein [Hungatella sp.]|nr:hypothetical protein [Hungatella sp.]
MKTGAFFATVALQAIGVTMLYICGVMLAEQYRPDRRKVDEFRKEINR